MKKLKLLAGVGCLLACAAAFAEATVSDLVVRSRRPWSRAVDLDFVLNGTSSAEPCHLDVAMTVDGVRRDIPKSELSGNWFCAIPGANRITWTPGEGVVEDKLKNVVFTLTPQGSSLYIAVLLSGSEASVDSRVRFLSAPDGADGKWSDTYKTDYMVFRYVPAGTFMMGSPTTELGRNVGGGEPLHQVTLTKGFYCGVFPCTEKQFYHFNNNAWQESGASRFTSRAAYPTRLLEGSHYSSHIRGNGIVANGWPTNGFGHAVAVGSNLDRMRKRTCGVFEFDLPTEAQWEYACRAGTTTAYNNGTDSLVGGSPVQHSTAQDANLDTVGRYAGTDCDGDGTVGRGSFEFLAAGFDPNKSGWDASTTGWFDAADWTAGPDKGGPPLAGQYPPNAWGLYDFIGGVGEWCLDMFNGLDSTPTVDPVGPAVSTSPSDKQSVGMEARVVRGGAWYFNYRYSRSAARMSNYASWNCNGWTRAGFRLVFPAK